MSRFDEKTFYSANTSRKSGKDKNVCVSLCCDICIMHACSACKWCSPFHYTCDVRIFLLFLPCILLPFLCRNSCRSKQTSPTWSVPSSSWSFTLNKSLLAWWHTVTRKYSFHCGHKLLYITCKYTVHYNCFHRLSISQSYQICNNLLSLVI